MKIKDFYSELIPSLTGRFSDYKESQTYHLKQTIDSMEKYMQEISILNPERMSSLEILVSDFLIEKLGKDQYTELFMPEEYIKLVTLAEKHNFNSESYFDSYKYMKKGFKTKIKNLEKELNQDLPKIIKRKILYNLDDKEKIIKANYKFAYIIENNLFQEFSERIGGGGE